MLLSCRLPRCWPSRPSCGWSKVQNHLQHITACVTETSPRAMLCAAAPQAAPLLAIPPFLRLEQFLLSKQEEGYRALLQQVRPVHYCLLVCASRDGRCICYVQSQSRALGSLH